jgi:hypothetical protein
MFSFGSAKSSIICKTNNDITVKMKVSTTLTNRKYKISINPMIFVFFIFLLR